MKAYVKDTQFFVPEQIITNEGLVKEFPEWDVEKIVSKIGIKQRHQAAKNETAADMAYQAAQKLFSKGAIKKEEIDFVIFCTQSPDYFLPTSACLLQDRLGLRTDIGAFDYNLGCSGYVYGLSIAKGLICSGIATNVLLLTGETYTKALHPKDRGNRSIFGDAASATVVSTEGIAEIMNFSLGTNGKGRDNLILKSGAYRMPEQQSDFHKDESGALISSDHIYMNGSEIFSFTLDAVPVLVKETLLKNNEKKEDIDLFIFHQANKYILDFLRKKIKIDKDKFYVCMENYGNTVSNTLPIALRHAIEDQSIQKGASVLLAGFGVGYSWGGVILNF